VLCVSVPLVLLRRLHHVTLVPTQCSPTYQEHRSDPLNRLLNYHASATVIRLLTTNALIAYITSWVLYLSGASEDPRLLLPAWISITTVQYLPFLSTPGQFLIILID
jgi:hypothetical protein